MTTSIRDIRDFVEKRTRDAERVLINVFCRAGEECIIEAKNGGSYTDQTGNLRSSIGYAVLKDGKVVQKGQIEKTKDGDTGLAEGSGYLERCIKANRRRDGIVLIVTAGMNYAEYVEAKGKVVLSSAELKAPDIVRELLLEVGFKLK